MTRLALLSVSDKTGMVEFARQLIDNFDFEILSSGGTAKVLQAEGLSVTKVSDYTGSPEILSGRVKTLHPRIHGGILGRRDLPQDVADMAANQIRPLDLVVVNLYPFKQTIAQPNVTTAEAIENIDIGGPAMLRAAAKNFRQLTVLCQPQQYDGYLQELGDHNGAPSLAFRQRMAKAAFALTQGYDQAIADYFTSLDSDDSKSADDLSMPTALTITGTAKQTLRYGENPHQAATWYQTGAQPTGWSAANQLQGKELSYNNLVDLEAARRIIVEFDSAQPTAAVLKHTNPCGVAVGSNLAEAYEKAFNADSISAFGGIVVLNQPIDAATAQAMTKTFLECIVAPACIPEAQEILATKSKRRVLLLPDLAAGPQQTIKAIAGGFLAQMSDEGTVPADQWQTVTDKSPTTEQLAELEFAWKVTKHVKSNAIVITKNGVTLGIGAGQMNRVGAAQIAIAQAGTEAQGATLASDGFFPFDDTVRSAAAAGITTIIQPGGSIRDQDSIQAANELGVVMVFSGRRHFLH